MPYKKTASPEDYEYIGLYWQKRSWGYYIKQQTETLKKAIGEELFNHLEGRIKKRGNYGKIK